MRLKAPEIERLARKVITHLQEKKLFLPKIPLPKLQQRVQELVQKNMEEEVAIDQETQKMMVQFEEAIRRGEVEYHRMYQMIKSKIAKERKFVL